MIFLNTSKITMHLKVDVKVYKRSMFDKKEHYF